MRLARWWARWGVRRWRDWRRREEDEKRAVSEGGEEKQKRRGEEDAKEDRETHRMSLEKIQSNFVLSLNERINDIPDVGLFVDERSEGLVPQEFGFES